MVRYLHTNLPAAVEQMLAQRGMSASTVGRDALINTIIQSAVPLAQAQCSSYSTISSSEKFNSSRIFS